MSKPLKTKEKCPSTLLGINGWREKKLMGLAPPGNAEGCENRGLVGGAIRKVMKRNEFQIDGLRDATRSLLIAGELVGTRLSENERPTCFARRIRLLKENLHQWILAGGRTVF